MKKYLLLLMLLCSIRVSAQDVIVKKDGSTIVCRVVEIGKAVITYKKWSNLKGPNYVIEKAEVTSVNYQNGEKDVFEEEDTPTPAPTPTPTPTPVQVTTFTPMVQGNSGQLTVSDDMLLKMAKKEKIIDPIKTKKKVKLFKSAGWLGGGLFIVAGTVVICTVSNQHSDADGNVIGPILMGCGVAMGAPLLIRAYHIEKELNNTIQSASIFNKNFYLKNGTSLSPSINMMKDNTRRNTTLGIGLSYNF